MVSHDLLAHDVLDSADQLPIDDAPKRQAVVPPKAEAGVLTRGLSAPRLQRHQPLTRWNLPLFVITWASAPGRRT